jgi:hypothetical protein
LAVIHFPKKGYPFSVTFGDTLRAVSAIEHPLSGYGHSSGHDWPEPL